MKRLLSILLLFVFSVSLVIAQSFTIRECTEAEIPSVRRAKYYDEAHQVVQEFYMLLLESVGNTDNRDVIIDQLINDSHAATLKTDFLLTQDNNLSFCNPLQYFTKLIISKWRNHHLQMDCHLLLFLKQIHGQTCRVTKRSQSTI